jgi:hypothetical protein
MPESIDEGDLVHILETALNLADASGELLVGLHIAHALEVLRLPPHERKCDPDVLQ